MLVASRAADILYTPNISGIHANFLRSSISAAGLDPENLPAHGQIDIQAEAKAWKTVWSAGQGVGDITDIPAAADLCERLIKEYAGAIRRMTADEDALRDGSGSHLSGMSQGGRADNLPVIG
jgi:nitronate monooxygenase